MSEARILTDEELRQIGALQVTPGSWWPSQRNGPNDVDRGKIWGFRAGPPPAQMIVVAEVNRFIGTAEDQQLIAAAPDLRRTALHLLQRAEKAERRASEWEQTGREAVDSVLICGVELDDVGIAPGPLHERVRSLLQQRDEARARVTELEAPGECNSIHKLRAEVARLRERLL